MAAIRKTAETLATDAGAVTKIVETSTPGIAPAKKAYKFGTDPVTGRSLTKSGEVRSERRATVYIIVGLDGSISFFDPEKGVMPLATFQDLGKVKAAYPADKFLTVEVKVHASSFLDAK